MKKYLIVLLLALSSSHAQQTVNQLAFIDDSNTSQQWLNSRANYLIEHHVFVMLIEENTQYLEKVKKAHQGLLIGLAPKPDKLTALLLKQWRVRDMPVIIPINNQ